VWEDVELPEDTLLIPGVITQSTVVVEHPELVDCGFASFAGSTEIHPSIVWAKLAALTAGARLASGRLWHP
jgi:5-methyltetrahydropteroyltriglutamate--homocysteine methyltransferase